ncbi:MAG: DUF5320 domain-containing protein [bacterium]
MPGGDRTGPQGAGPMTGRGAGMCAGYEMPGYVNNAPGRGFGGARGRGFGGGFQGGGRGRCHQYYATGVPGWARRFGYNNAPSAMSPWGSGAPMDTKSAEADELVALKQQTQYFKGVLEELEARVNELQGKAGHTSGAEQKEK